jgi:hypothetical protein
MMVFAAKNKDKLAHWIKVLTQAHEAKAPTVFIPEGESEPEEDVMDNDDDDEPLPDVESMSKKELAMLYFEEYDICSQAVCTKLTPLCVIIVSMYSWNSPVSSTCISCYSLQANLSKRAINEKLFPDLMNYIGIQLSSSDLFFSLQSVKNEKGQMNFLAVMFYYFIRNHTPPPI